MKRQAVTVFGPPESDPNCAPAAVVVVEQSRENPHAAFLHVTGTGVCGNRERLPRNVRRRTERVADASDLVNMPRVGPVEVPWPVSAFALPWPFSEGVMRLLVAAAQKGAPEAVLHAAFRLYMSPRHTTPARHTVVSSLLGAQRSCSNAGGGFTVFGITVESPGLNYVVRTAVQHNTVLCLPRSVYFPDTNSFYDGFIRCIMGEAVHRIAARYAGTGPKWATIDGDATAACGTVALELANEIGLLELTPDRRNHMVTMLGPRSRFRGLTSSMQSCYSEDRQTGHNCIACPLKFDQKQALCDASYSDKPANVWARRASCDGELSVASLAATVPPCMAQFGTMRGLTYRRRQDVANAIKLVTASVH